MRSETVAAAVVSVFVAATVAYGGGVFADQYNQVMELYYDPARPSPWRVIGPVGPHTEEILLAIDGRACGELKPRTNTTLNHGPDTIVITVTVTDAASNCIPNEQVTVPVTVYLKGGLGNRRLVDWKGVSP